jgi:NADH:ubiquinone oxidoreductase subunit 2 (subunit N)
LPRNELGALTVGVFQDFLGMAMSALVAIVAGIVILDGVTFSREIYPEKAYAALLFSTAGVVLAWNSLTPWLALGGLTLAIIGGFISLGSRWDSNAEANLASRFIYERATGFLLSFFGTCILAVPRSALLLNDAKSWVVSSESLSSSWIGACFLVLGFFVQMQPFPFLGWVVSSSTISPTIRVLLNQIFPAWTFLF